MSKVLDFFWGKGSKFAYAIITAFFTVAPEDCFKTVKICDKWPKTANVLIIRLISCVIILILSNVVYCIYKKLRRTVSVNGDNYSIQIEYGNLLEVSAGKVVIDFDECFSTKVGEAPADIKPTSVCAQYLSKYPISNMPELINKAGVKPAKNKSQYHNQVHYTPGTIVPNGRFLLMAFAKIDQNGLGHLTYEEYIECLNTLWEQIDLYHGTSDVYIPILGSKITRLDRDLTQQQLLDIMVCSYQLSPKKMKKPYKLHIVCREREGFSINDAFRVD